MEEIEVKFLNIKLGAIQRKLVEIGARKLGEYSPNTESHYIARAAAASCFSASSSRRLSLTPAPYESLLNYARLGSLARPTSKKG
jgi:hypothetical protein